MNDIDQRIETLLRESVDADLGDRLERPFDPAAMGRSPQPRRRATTWLLPLAAAAAVVAIASGTVAVVDAASGGSSSPGHAGSSPAPTLPNRSAAASAARSAAASAAARSAATAAAARSAASAAARRALEQRLAAQAQARARVQASLAAAAQARQARIEQALRGPWHGHDRTLTVAASGAAAELLTSGCCSPGLHVTFVLSNVTGTESASGEVTVTATARVTSVRLDPGFTYDPGESRPAVGETGTVHVEHGVLSEPFTGTIYCGSGVSSCGA